jgi:hypothetical protein
MAADPAEESLAGIQTDDRDRPERIGELREELSTDQGMLQR